MPSFFKSKLQKYLDKLAKNDPTLHTINLKEKKIGDAEVAQLVDALVAGNTTAGLTVLEFWHNKIGPTGAASLASFFRTNRSLEKIDLGWNPIGDEGVTLVVSSLRQHPTLMELRLGSAGITDVSVTSIVTCLLETNQALEKLYLWNNDVGPQGAASIASSLRQNDTLKELQLGHNDIGDAGAASFGSALEHNQVLERLDVESAKITDEGAAALASSLRNNRALKRLDLSWNKITYSGAALFESALLHNNHYVHVLELKYNNITDEGLLQRIQNLLAMNSWGPMEAVRKKNDAFGMDLSADTQVVALAGADMQGDATDTKSPSPFFTKLMEDDQRNINLKLTELFPLIEDVHEMKIFYTVVSTCLRLHLVAEHDASSYIRQGLDQSWNKCIDENAIVIFKLVLEKAHDDDHIDRADFHRYDNRAEVTRMGHAPFVKSMQEAIRANTQRIQGLESNVAAVNDSVNAIKRGIRHKQKVEAATGFFGAIINAVSMGVAGSLLVAFEKAISSIVDFGDLRHMKDIVTSTGDSQVLEQFEFGIEIASGRADKPLEDAVKNDNALLVLSASAYLVHSEAPEIAEDDEKDDKGGFRQPRAIFDDAEFDEEEEEECPIHAAVKFGDRDSLEDVLDQSDMDVNMLDSQRRTAMDLAALTGQLELMELIERHGGKFMYKSKPRMLAIGKKRKPFADEYLEHVHADL